jgi:methylmalonyl-CoA mutase cobalamin-binding subunit
MKVVLPLPAIPTQTIDTGRFDVLDEAVDAAGAVDVDMVKVCSLVLELRVL